MNVRNADAYWSLASPEPIFIERARKIGTFAVYGSIAFALTIPLSWLFNVPILRNDIPVMTPAHLLGVSFSILIGISLLLLYHRLGTTMAYMVCWTIAISAFIVVLEYVTPNELPFAPLIRVLDPVEDMDKISPNGALCLLLSAASALFARSETRWNVRISQWSALLSALVAGVALIGHGYEIESLYGISDYSAMSVPGALSYLLLAVSLFCFRPERGLMRILVMPSAAGVMSRRLYLTAVLVPPILGFLAVITSAVWKWYDLSFAIVLFVMASILFFAIVVTVTSRRLEWTDGFRISAERDLRDSRERLRELSAHIQVMQEEERVRIAREVHDELGQSLTALKMDVAMLRKQLAPSEEVERRMASMLDLVNGTIRSVQRISAELRPSVLDDLGLVAAIEWQAKEFEERSGIACILDLPTEDFTAQGAQATALFRIFQETLTNVARHAEASMVEVQLRKSMSQIELRVRDNGVGIDLDNLTNAESLGVMGMRERAALTGGTLTIESSPGAGMTVIVRMPALENQLETEALASF